MQKAPKKDSRGEERSGGIRSEIVDEVCKQIERYLPVKSIDDLLKKVQTISIGPHEIPVRLIAPHVGREAFPVKDTDDLRRKIVEGAERAVSLGASPSFTPRNQLFDQALGTLTQTEARIGLRLPAIYRTYYPE